MLLYHICCCYLNNKVLHWVLISVDKRWAEQEVQVLAKLWQWLVRFFILSLTSCCIFIAVALIDLVRILNTSRNCRHNQTFSIFFSCLKFWHSQTSVRWCYTRRFATTNNLKVNLKAQHSIATLLRYCFEWLQHCSSIVTLCCAKNRRCESSRVTSPVSDHSTEGGRSRESNHMGLILEVDGIHIHFFKRIRCMWYLSYDMACVVSCSHK